MNDELANITSGIEFENDFGQETLGLGRLTKDQGVIAVSSLVGAFVGTAIAGLPLAAIVLLVGLNDILSVNKKRKKEPNQEPQAIDVESTPVEPTAIGQDTRLDAIQVNAVDLPKSIIQLSPFDRNRIISESKGLTLIGDSGSAKTCVAMYIANGFNGYGIIVFDPHAKTDWGNAYVITKMPAIYEQMRILLDVLDDGDESPFLVICDEWMEIRFDRLNKSGDYKGLADDFIRLFSTKPRKFNKLAVFVLHSPNVEAAGIDSSLRENYEKIYLGRLAKKEFPDIQDCAYPCVFEDEQIEHPTHGHHNIFRKNGNAPRDLQPLNSAAINIPLAYIDRGEVKVHKGGWVNGSFAYKTNARERLELLWSDTNIDMNIDMENRKKDPESSDIRTDMDIDMSDMESDMSDIANAETPDITGGLSDIERDTSDMFTSAQLPRHQALRLIDQMKISGLSQTQIIQALWGCEKNKAGWSKAYSQFKELTGGVDD